MEAKTFYKKVTVCASKKQEKSGKENKPCPGRKATAATRLVKKKSAALIKNQCPSAAKVSKQELTTLTRKLLNLEARVGWLEERLKEKAHQSRPLTTDRGTSTDGFPALMSTLLETPTPESDENEPFPHYSALEEKTTSASGHLDDADVPVGLSLDFPSAASTPLVDRTVRQQTPSEHISSMDCTPVRENLGFSLVSNATSFCLRLPETPPNASHYHVRRSLIQGVIQPDITLNHVPLETEQRMYLDSTGPDGKPRADRFAVHLFKRLIPLRVYQDWVGLVNFDGSRGKNALPHNVRQAISDAVAKKFHATAQDWKQIKDRINEILRKKRLSFPLF
ncbi:uncharacterized protein [Paramormyrops kingsleyae]|uniref:uncharacterized protein n=1 Tax=Paramormyrops kingsleyae TaxID=1676925 RepID=UPI003B97226F